MAKGIKKIKVAIADDHVLLRKALANLINTFPGYEVIIEADNGKELRNSIQQHQIPEIALVDVNMPEMDGFEITQWLKKNHPYIKVLVLSMMSDEKTIIKMFRLGAKGYLLKNTDPAELKEAFDSIINKDVYLSEYVSGKLVSGLNHDADPTPLEIVLNEKERDFLRWTCTEFSYREIAEKMYLSARTVDDYRQSLFNKLKVHSRVGLAIYAIKHGIAEI